MGIQITLSAEEYEVLGESVNAKVEYYQKAVSKMKRNGNYTQGYTTRMLTAYTNIQKKLA